MKLKKYSCIIGFCFFLVSTAFGQNIETIKALVKLQSKTDSLEKKMQRQDSALLDQSDILAAQQKKALKHDSDLVEIIGALHRQYGIPAIADEGFTIGIGATMVLQGTSVPNAVTSSQKRVADASYSADLTFQKKFAKAGSRAFLHCEAAGGKGLDGDLLVFSRVNFDAVGPEGLRVAEAWYEQTFIEGGLYGVIGLMDPSLYFDCNVSANDETTQFLNQLFVSSPVIEYPAQSPGLFYSPGIFLSVSPWDWLHLRAAAYDANQDWQRIGDNLFNIGQIAICPKILGWKGNCRLYGWFNQMPHTRWNNPADSMENSYGFGVSFDQECNDLLTPFGRFGWRNPLVHLPASPSGTASLSWSAGTQLNGKAWHRVGDGAGIAVGQLIASDDYAKQFPQAHAQPETHCEVYYRIQCFDKMSITPDFQYIINPFGKDAPLTTSDIPVIGIRSEVDF